MDHQTFAQMLGNYGEFFGAIAVVTTLIFLSSQIRQNTRALSANSREYSASSYHTIATAVFPDVEFGDLLAKAHRADPSQFTPGERERIGWFLIACLKSAETQHIHWREGVLDDAVYRPVMANLKSLISSFPLYAPAFWDAARDNYSDDFQEVVSVVVDELRH